VMAMQNANALTYDPDEQKDLRGVIPESWLCIDCGFNTAPGLLNRVEMGKAVEAAMARGEWGPKAEGGNWGIPSYIDNKSEVYSVRDVVWQRAGMQSDGGCLCIGCLEKRIGRQLKPKDFQRDSPFNSVPTGTLRLLKRRR
jgi:hypothetical protein